MINAHVYTPAVKMMTTSSVCMKCGIIAKSGRVSCCGHGGSWFGKCASVNNEDFDQTWYEGIQACQLLSQSRTAIGRQSNAAQQRNYSAGSAFNPTSSPFTITSTGVSSTTATANTTDAVTTNTTYPTLPILIQTVPSSSTLTAAQLLGIISICVFFLILITLTLTICFPIEKTTITVKG